MDKTTADVENAFRAEALLGADYVGASARVSCEGLHPSKALSAGHWVGSIALEAAVGTLFVAIFYIFILPTAIESKAVSGNIDRTMKGVVDRFAAALTHDEVADLAREAQHLEAPDMAAQDADAKASNAKLTRQSFAIVGPICSAILLLILVVYLVTRAKAMKKSRIACPGVDFIDLPLMAKVGALATLSMIIIYFAFSFLVATRYRSVDPAVIEGAILDTLISFGESG